MLYECLLRNRAEAPPRSGDICAATRFLAARRRPLQISENGSRFNRQRPATACEPFCFNRFHFVVHLRLLLRGTPKTAFDLVAYPEYLAAALLALRVVTLDDHSCAAFDKQLLPAVSKVAKCGEISPGTAEIAAVSRRFSPERTRRCSQ